MKKLTAILLCLVILCLAAACSSAKTTSAPETETPVTETPTTETPVTETSVTETPATETPVETETPTTETPTTETPVTETPVETETPVDPLEKKKNNTALLTEDDIKVKYHVGLYEFVFEDGTKLGINPDTEEGIAVPADATENCTFLVVFQNAGTDVTTVGGALRNGEEGVRYVLFVGDSVENTLWGYSWGVEVNGSSDQSMYSNWYILDQGNGKAVLQNVSSDRYLVKTEDDEVTMKQEKDLREGLQYQLEVRQLQEGTSCFNQFISEKGNIILRTNEKITKRARVSYERLAKLANDMQVAYDTYVDLTNYRVWDSIVLRIYRTEPYFGYIYPSWNTVSFNLSDAISDMSKMPLRDNIGINDWSFCLLHEMGHMFDAYRGWKFYTEFATNFKVAYNLRVNLDVGASAATAEYAYRECYDGEQIKYMWAKIGNKDWDKNIMKSFDLDRMLYVFVDYAETIGWEHVREAYHDMQSWETQETVDRVKQLNDFTDTMAKYAPDHQHVRDFFGEGEWQLIINEIDGSTY